VAEVPNLTALRRRLHLSQGAFATLFGIPLATVKDWEQGRRNPDAPARAYLRVIAQNPRAVRSALQAAE
jgi:putative transcriptional regulator